MALNKISPAELHERLRNGNAVILDVRDEEKYRNYHLEHPNAKSMNIHKNEIFKLVDGQEAAVASLPKDKEIIITCTTGNSAAKCADILEESGFEAIVLEGGVTAWKEYID